MFCKITNLRPRIPIPANYAICDPGFSLFNSRSAGFTLLEILVALAIIGMTLVTVLHTLNYHSSLAYENAVTTQMVQLAKEKMSGLEDNPVNAKGSIEGTSFTFDNIVTETDDPSMINMRTIVKGNGKEVVLNEFVYRK